MSGGRSVMLVLAGTSGAGKGTIARELVARNPALWLSVSATTRSPRAGERDGIDYWFLTSEEFTAQETNGGFVESFSVFGNRYGTPRAPLDERRANGDDVVLEIDVQGAAAIKATYPDALLVFVRTSSRAIQRQRLLARDPDVDPDILEARLAAAPTEEAEAENFSAVVINENFEQAVQDIELLMAQKRNSE